MERNPYQPPETPVSDGNEGLIVRPQAVTAAVFVLFFGLVAFVFDELMRAPVMLRLAAFGRPLANAIGVYLVFIPGREWFRAR